MASTRFAFACLLVSCAGCSSDDAHEKLVLNNLPAYPPHWRNTPGQGTDSTVGQLTSTEHKLVIKYDIGRLAGEYADAKAYPEHQWVKSGQLAGSKFQYLLDKGDTLYVTFSSEGPANFWASISDQSDIDYMIELLAKYRSRMVTGLNSG